MDDIGSCAIQRIDDPGGDPEAYTARILQADRRIWVARELLDTIRDYPPINGWLRLDGDVLTIRDDYGQRFIYRIRWDDYRDGGYLAEWPD